MSMILRSSYLYRIIASMKAYIYWVQVQKVLEPFWFTGDAISSAGAFKNECTACWSIYIELRVAVVVQGSHI